MPIFQFRSADVFAAKQFVDESVRRHLDRAEARGKIVVIFDVDLLPPEATLLLHGFADHENSPFKDAFLFLTLSRRYDLAPASDEAAQKEVERRAARDLDDALSSTLGLDATKALMARIANNVVVLASESQAGER